MDKPLTSIDSHQYLIYSPQLAAQTPNGAGFWSEATGWGTLGVATLYTKHEVANVGPALIDDAYRMHSEPCARRSLIEKAMTVLREDAFDVYQTPDRRWSWADEQDRDCPEDGEFATQGEAWADLALARAHILEEAGISAAGLFEKEGPNPSESMYMARMVDQAFWTYPGKYPAVVLMTLEDIVKEAKQFLDNLAAAAERGEIGDTAAPEAIEFISDVGTAISMVDAIALFPHPEQDDIIDDIDALEECEAPR